jgi:Xaa-Pro aminopeptidase
MISTISEKILQARSLLAERGVDCWLTFVRETSSICDPALELILGTNVVWPSAFIIGADAKAFAIVGSLDVQNVKDHAPYEVVGYRDSIREALRSTLEGMNPGRIAINYSTADVTADGLTFGMHKLLCEYLEGTPFPGRFESSEPVVTALRSRKSASEIAAVQSAVDETLSIFGEVTRFLKPGLTEKDVAGFILERTKERGLEPAWDPESCPAVFTGPESAGAHAMPTARTMEPGHLMNIDFGVRKNGYVSDLQRTWYFLEKGEKRAPADAQKGFLTIRNAIRRSAEALKPGAEGWAVDKTARDLITDAGYSEYPHALGHQVGRKAHDGGGLLAPKWERYKDLPMMKVEAEQLYTLEPRLTVEGRGVATVEEIVVVTENGCRFLSSPQEDLICIGFREA